MSASLVGSEMCIRDSPRTPRHSRLPPPFGWTGGGIGGLLAPRPPCTACLLYTSDAADDMQ
eukprot:4041364-Alexandrium_andersonii.AAC.1